MIDLSDNPSSTETGKQLELLSRRIRQGKQAKPPENYLVVMLFAGHGILKDGMQVLLYNEYDHETGFYKMLKAEAKMRIWAEIFPNLYILGIFASCR